MRFAHFFVPSQANRKQTTIMKHLICIILTLLAMGFPVNASPTKNVWPDGTEMDAWFQNTKKVDATTLGRRYVITDYGVTMDSAEVQTPQIQAVIDRAARQF